MFGSEWFMPGSRFANVTRETAGDVSSRRRTSSIRA
jgi:hypothetical protein